MQNLSLCSSFRVSRMHMYCVYGLIISVFGPVVDAWMWNSKTRGTSRSGLPVFPSQRVTDFLWQVLTIHVPLKIKNFSTKRLSHEEFDLYVQVQSRIRVTFVRVHANFVSAHPIVTSWLCRPTGFDRLPDRWLYFSGIKHAYHLQRHWIESGKSEWPRLPICTFITAAILRTEVYFSSGKKSSKTVKFGRQEMVNDIGDEALEVAHKFQWGTLLVCDSSGQALNSSFHGKLLGNESYREQCVRG